MQARAEQADSRGPLSGASSSFGSHVDRRASVSTGLILRNDLISRLFCQPQTGDSPLEAEAKVLDITTSKTVALYCDKGIRRFVEGEYAWGTREAFMIGYVRDGSSISVTLAAFLSKTIKLQPQHYRVESLPVPAASGSSDLAYTRHGRTFVYASQPPPNTPGSISIWHLWLS